ncbi:MAG TPA: Rrf2 family transcriptional regulator [Candidatus Aquilonibacter sp.]|nr:Rrf2 family transcriptional regulator [Candidatus Aquilonibacter sp.]
MRLTKETEHAIEALTYLGSQKPATIVEASMLADEIDVPRPFMSKILQRLAKAGLVRGHRGNPRGYSLAVSPARLSMRRVLESMEGEDLFSRCIFFSETCSETNSCPLHDAWKRVRPLFRTMMNDLTVADLAARK